MIEGKVGSRKLVWKNTPKGKAGEGVVEINGKPQAVKWIRDDQGIWIETENGYVGYDVRKTLNDDGVAQYSLLKRRQAGLVNGLSFLKAGEESTGGEAKVKKGAKVKSQMPGKILRVNIKAGDAVKKGQGLMVMEAMKMENEIKASQDGIVKEIKVTEGQAVETGAELVIFQ